MSRDKLELAENEAMPGAVLSVLAHDQSGHLGTLRNAAYYLRLRLRGIPNALDVQPEQTLDLLEKIQPAIQGLYISGFSHGPLNFSGANDSNLPFLQKPNTHHVSARAGLFTSNIQQMMQSWQRVWRCRIFRARRREVGKLPVEAMGALPDRSLPVEPME